MTEQPGHAGDETRYIVLPREVWARLRSTAPLTLTKDDLSALQGLNEDVSMREVEEIYLPVARLLDLYVAATEQLHQVTATFLGRPVPKVPYVIGLAGSVAVGKSTTARILQSLLSRGPGRPTVDLVATDGFLYPNAILEERGLTERKGFPESYDVRRLVNFVRDIKAGRDSVSAPEYSHLIYDIVPDAVRTVRRPDILILEGLDVLQPAGAGAEGRRSRETLFVSDFFDFSIYVDAEESSIRQWFLDRFLRLRATAFQEPDSFFHEFARLSIEEATEIANDVWDRINGVNLQENIAPTRERADLILEKAPDHSVQTVRLRKL